MKTQTLKNNIPRALTIGYTVLLIVVLFLFVVSFSIALPIWVRPFYYWQIDALDIVEYSGYSKEVIIDAFNELMDYLNFNQPFGTGELAYSEEGQSHFTDCKVLFDLDTYVCLACGVVLIAALILAKKKVLVPCRFARFDLGFFAGITVIAVAAILVTLFAIDFDAAFEVFHTVFFPGKDNWLFSPRYDQIINVLPEWFFAACGILIGCSMAVLSTLLIVFGAIKRFPANQTE